MSVQQELFFLPDLLERIANATERIADVLERQNKLEWARTPEGLPICPKHDAPMHKREKQGDEWYSHAVVDPQTGEKLYCRGYRSKNGLGWQVDAGATMGPDADARRSQPTPGPQQPAKPRASKSPTKRNAPVANGGYRFANGHEVPEHVHDGFDRYRQLTGRDEVDTTEFWVWYYNDYDPEAKPGKPGARRNGSGRRSAVDIDQINDDLFG